MAAKENSKYYSLGYDRMFKSLIANPQNPKYLNLILTDILEEPVEVVEFLPTEVKVRNKKSKLNILDIIVKTQNNKLLNIELNMRFSPAVKERNLLYYADFYSQSIRRGEKKAENIIHIDINFKGGREEKEDYYVMNNKLEKYSEYFRLIVVNIEKYKEHWFDKNIEGDKEHMYLVMLGLDKKEIEKLSKVDEVIKEVKDKMLILNSDNRIISTISREEKITSLAREEGIEIGREKGKEEGLFQAKINIAKNLLKRNMKIKDILEITGLSEEDIKPLQKFC